MAKKTAAKKAKTPRAPKADPAKSWASIQDSVSAINAEVESFANGNASAGRRMRKSLQEIRKAAATMRKEIQEVINSKK